MDRAMMQMGLNQLFVWNNLHLMPNVKNNALYKDAYFKLLAIIEFLKEETREGYRARP